MTGSGPNAIGPDALDQFNQQVFASGDGLGAPIALSESALGELGGHQGRVSFELAQAKAHEQVDEFEHVETDEVMEPGTETGDDPGPHDHEHDQTADHGEHDEHAAAGAHGEDHGDGHGSDGEYHMPAELPNLYTIGFSVVTGRIPHHETHGEEYWKHPGFYATLFLSVIPFAILSAGILLWLVRRGIKNPNIEQPGRWQVAVEGLFQGLFNFFGEVVGEAHARKFVPFVGTMWLFILVNNWFGMVPFMRAPTAMIGVTGGLAFCTFIYVNYNGIKEGGLGHYLWHMCGSPTSAIAWVFAVLIFPLELIGTFVKPISLALRLFGNIFGEDTLLAVFLGLGMMITATLLDTPTPFIGIPFQLPFYFFALLAGTIQATVFALLSAVYIALLLPHHAHEHEDEHETEHVAAH